MGDDLTNKTHGRQSQPYSTRTWHTNAHTRVFTHASAHTHAQTHIHTHTLTHTHTHTLTHSLTHSLTHTSLRFMKHSIATFQRLRHLGIRAHSWV